MPDLDGGGCVVVSLLPLFDLDQVVPVSRRAAARIVEREHYLHRPPSISYAYGLSDGSAVVTFGQPPSRHLQISACPSAPERVIELNRLWADDKHPRNFESWFLARALKLLPAFIVVSFADTAQGHDGCVYRASNFRYAGWTDMDRKTPRFDYVTLDGSHSRNAFRTGWEGRQARQPKVKYWTVTGDKRERRALLKAAGWPSMDWAETPWMETTHV